MIFHSNATLYSNSSITTDLTSRPTNWTTEGNPEKIILESQVHMYIYKHLFHKQSSIAIFTVQTVPQLQIMQECFYIPSQLSKASGKQQFQLIRVPKPCNTQQLVYAYVVPVEKHTTKSKILLLTNQVQNSWHITKIFCLTPNRPMSSHAIECMHTQRCLTGIFQFHSHHQHNISTWQGVN